MPPHASRPAGVTAFLRSDTIDLRFLSGILKGGGRERGRMSLPTAKGIEKQKTLCGRTYPYTA